MECKIFNEFRGCCCECKYQRVIYKHPYNKDVYAKGSIIEPMGYICDIQDGLNHPIFSDRKHSMCEEFEQK